MLTTQYGNQLTTNAAIEKEVMRTSLILDFIRHARIIGFPSRGTRRITLRKRIEMGNGMWEQTEEVRKEGAEEVWSVLNISAWGLQSLLTYLNPPVYFPSFEKKILILTCSRVWKLSTVHDSF